MAQIAFLLLCHKDPDAIITQAETLTGAGDFVSIHFDGRAPRATFDRITQALSDNPSVTFARRIKCGWGEWSLVQATLNAAEAALEAFPTASHFYLVSGDCMPVKSVEYMRALLDAEDVDYCECVDFTTGDWIKTGFKEERLIYRHWFNERTQKALFYRSYNLQRSMGLTRKVPEGLSIMIGSQWWCLRRRTLEAIFDCVAERPDIVRFFRTTWIPDEIFFQSLVRHLVPAAEIRSRTLTFLVFTDYGMPVTFYNDHYDFLVSQDALFARKVSPEASALKARLQGLFLEQGATFEVSGEGKQLYAYVSGRGRYGGRFGPRFWEATGSGGDESELLILACKKWHVGKRLVGEFRKASNVTALDYLFNEQDTPLPDLGGIETTVAKRTRHRRVLVSLLFEYYQTDRLLVCVDPSRIDLIRDLYGERTRTKLLDVEVDLSDAYLIEHARRVGLLGQNAPRSTVDLLLTTIRRDVAEESSRLRSEALPETYRIRQSASIDENTLPLAQFLGISPEAARSIAATDHLFAG